MTNNAENKPVKLLENFKKNVNNHVVIIIFFTLIAALANLVPVTYMKTVYGSVIDARSTHNLIYETFVLIIGLLLAGILEIIRSRILLSISLNFDKSISSDLFDLVVIANIRKTVEGSRTMFTHLKILRDFMGSKAVEAITDIPTIFIYLAIVFSISPKLGYFSLLSACILASMTIYSELKVKPLMQRYQAASMPEQDLMVQVAKNATSSVAMGIEQNIYNKWNKISEENQKLLDETNRLASRTSTISKFIQNTQSSIVVGLSCWLMLDGQLTDGSLLLIASIISSRAMAPIMVLIGQLKKIGIAIDSYKKISDFLDKSKFPPALVPLPKPNGKLEISKMVLRAPLSRKLILSNIEFSVQPGNCLMIIGESGAGKSSLIKGILGLWQPSSGSIRLDDVDTFYWDKRDLGQYIGYLPQDINLFEGTIKSNISRFQEENWDFDDKYIQLLDLNNIFNLLPNSINSYIGPGGVVLSQGQMQKIGLARALYKNPQLILLDEPTAHLDKASIGAFKNLIKYLKQQLKTVVIVSHNNQLLNISDQLLVLGNGITKYYGPTQKVIDVINQRNNIK